MGKKRRQDEQSSLAPQESEHSTALPSPATTPIRKLAKEQVESSVHSQAIKDQADDADDIGEFEDAWEDDNDDEEDDEEGDVIVHQDSDDEDEDMDVDAEKQLDDEEELEDALDVYLPGQALDEGEVLVPDNSAYEMLHFMGVEWPCLSLDFLSSPVPTSGYPVSVYMVSGSQAERPKDNKVYIMKASQLHRTKHDDDNEMQDDDSDHESDLDDDPILEYKTIPQTAGINRVRAMPHQDPSIQLVAAWSEVGQVRIWNVAPYVNALDSPGYVVPKEAATPIGIVDHKRVEGYAMDWSLLTSGRLLTGDVSNNIYLTSRTTSSFETETTPFLAHTASVEDLQWSPTEKDVFASCSADGTVKIWDARAKKRGKAQLSVTCHASDVNVVSWNRSVSHLLASGSESGEFSIWDLRQFQQVTDSTPPVPAATFSWHKKPITSIEWHPVDASVLLLTCGDDTTTIWDLSLERDPEEELVLGTGPKKEVDVPPQLLFVHQGQTEMKEGRWCRDAGREGVAVVTASDGMAIFKTINA
ncbi:hypothetical protein SmJEL517_g03668 [Synchytrium microbalum]|uniref:Histone-binding protein RBBP4-like N-terminal domain-containing protein n=1 Tax=Synchytrium microbalum TaxID=1806994 RepID=A0A507C377_9FUNG|nr:uncharacterized protein SmJEL517_g03668 [Synchytrium microbalum]TPX33499.1 hypothetical protein SmJEL517_g03668 [Synchytrium microbalum]